MYKYSQKHIPLLLKLFFNSQTCCLQMDICIHVHLKHNKFNIYIYIYTYTKTSFRSTYFCLLIFVLFVHVSACAAMLVVHSCKRSLLLEPGSVRRFADMCMVFAFDCRYSTFDCGCFGHPSSCGVLSICSSGRPHRDASHVTATRQMMSSNTLKAER